MWNESQNKLNALMLLMLLADIICWLMLLLLDGFSVESHAESLIR